jgi:hypothetical protein
MHGVVVASFNVHGGVDGFGRPFDVVSACGQLDADLLVLQECWSPASEVSLAQRVGDALGYEVQELALTQARVLVPPDPTTAPTAWGPVLWAHGPYGMRVGVPRPRPQTPGSAAAPSGSRLATDVEEGAWGIALLSRIPLLSQATLDLGQLSRDPARRGALVVEVDIEGRPLRVIGTHMSHLTHGSVFQLRTLRRLAAEPGNPAVLVGDMNIWGPPLSALMPGWTRVVRGRTWPAWRPVAQLDHILVTAGVETVGPGEVVPVAGSDHLPVRARLTLS